MRSWNLTTANRVTTSGANGSYYERTNVFYGAENVLKTELQIFSNAAEKIDSCMNFTRQQLAVELELIKPLLTLKVEV